MADWEERGQRGTKERVLTVRLKEALESELKSVAEARGIPASEAMREAISLWVTTERSAVVTRGTVGLVRLGGLLRAGRALGRRAKLMPGRDAEEAEGRALREDLNKALRAIEEDLRSSERDSASLRKKITGLEDAVQELAILREKLKRGEENRRKLLAEQEAMGRQLAQLTAMLNQVEDESEEGAIG